MTEPFLPPPVALLMGGLDPSCGAGILRDALTVAAHGVQPMVLPTAETLQNGVACLQIGAPGMSPRLRLEALAPHLTGSWGVKLGLADLAMDDLAALASDLKALNPSVAIWDPVLAPTAGVGLHDGRALGRMADRLLAAHPWVVAPNRLEAAALAELPADADPVNLARPWLDRGASAIWLKGGHGEGAQVEDLWMTREGAVSLGASPRLEGERRGTGCTLASTWLALRLKGADEVAAARAAAAWVRERWYQAFSPGGAGRPMFGPMA